MTMNNQCSVFRIINLFFAPHGWVFFFEIFSKTGCNKNEWEVQQKKNNGKRKQKSTQCSNHDIYLRFPAINYKTFPAKAFICPHFNMPWLKVSTFLVESRFSIDDKNRYYYVLLRITWPRSLSKAHSSKKKKNLKKEQNTSFCLLCFDFCSCKLVRFSWYQLQCCVIK